MTFARKIWRLLVAIKDGLALLLLLLFFGLLYAALSSRPGPAQVRDGALLLRLDGSVVEEPSRQDPLGVLLSQEAPVQQYAARDVIRALRASIRDAHVKAVVLDLSRFTGGGYVNMRDIGAAMDAVRASGKPVLTYALAYTDDSTLLAAHASEVWLHPLGGAFVIGPGGNQLYFADLLDRLKVTAHIFRVGTYKSAVEPFLRNDMSDAAREQGRALYGALWDNWRADVLRARPKAKVDAVARDPLGWLRASGGDTAKAALAAGLVDKLGDESQFGDRVARIAGEDPANDTPGSFAHTSLRTFLAAHAPAKAGKAIGVVTIAGTIIDGDAGPGTAGGDRITGLLDKALDDDLAALVVRVDSPGGSILASEQIRAAIARHKANGIPVVVSMGNLAASGGYWVSTPADRIFAEPGTITGSIGVFAVLPTFEKALQGIGVHADGVATTPFSGQPDVAGGLSPQVEQVMQATVEGSYARFLGLVAKSRGQSVEAVDRIAQGRVWDGGTARQLGLVDQFGTLDDALVDAARRAGLKAGEWHPQFLDSGSGPWADLLEQMSRKDDAETARSGVARDGAGLIALRRNIDLAQAGSLLRLLVSSPGAQAYCLECPVSAEIPTRTGSLAGLAGAAMRWLGLIDLH